MLFRDDDRAQSIQIGAVLLFAVLIILFALYQGFLIPAQNREVEFNHNQQVQGDMVDVRNAILSTRATGQDGYATVRLGTEYPARLVGINPSPPSGSLSTTAQRPIVVEAGGSDVTDAVCPGTGAGTRMLQYNPTYAEYGGAGTLRYDNSLLYHNFTDGAFLLTDQRLVQGDTVSIVPLNRSYNAGGSQTVSVEPRAGLVDSSTRTDPTITLPTRLSETRWEDALAGEVAPSAISVSAGADGRNLTLDLTGEYTIECAPVGLGQSPASGERGDGADGINPAAPGDIRLEEETRIGSDTMRLTFNNTGGKNNFTAGRINFFDRQGNTPPEANISAAGDPVSATLEVPGDFVDFSPRITLPGDGTETDVLLDFDGNPNNGWFVLTLELETGETATYFVPT